MNKIKPQQTQEAFQLIGQLASLAATPNINGINVNLVNELITSILEKVVVPAAQEFTETASGLLV